MSFQVVCFDFDSTLSRVEGIDELARRAGLFEQIVELTNAAMNGEVPLEAVYAQRLDLIKPNREAVAWLAQLYIDEAVAGAAETVAILQNKGKAVHIVSGGFRQAILPLAAQLGIPETQVHAVDVFFDDNGDYLDFDRQSPLPYSGGKAKVISQLIQGIDSLAMVGDGKTDLEAQQAGATVIGFGGVVVRDAVRDNADMYVTEPSLLAVLPYLL